MRTCGSVLRERSMRSVGAVTIASPAITVCPRWFTHVQSSDTRPSRSSRAVTFTVVVSVSPARIGARKFSVWRSYTVPAPGSRVPSTAEMSAAPHMPCAITPVAGRCGELGIEVARVDVARQRREQLDVGRGQRALDAGAVADRGSRRRCGCG